MANIIHQGFATVVDLGASATIYMPIGCSTRYSADITVEAQAAHTWRTAGTLTNLYINIIVNSRGTSTLRTRKATANANLVVSITASTTGKFEDTTNSDVVAAGDNWHLSMVTGSGGASFQYRTYMLLFSATTNTNSRVGADGNNAISTASSTQVAPLAGDGTHTAGGTDSVMGVTYRVAGTLKNLHVNVASNARTTTTTMRSRLNSANGALAISIGAGVTGVLEDTSNTDTIASGNLINVAFVTGTGTETLMPGLYYADFATTTNQAMYTAAAGGGNSVAAGVTTYYGFSGALRTTTTESNMIAESNLAFTGSLLQCNISANTIALASTVNFRKNSANGNQTVSITALTTGVFQDTVNSDSITASDTVNYQLITPSTATSITLTSISMLGTTTVTTTTVQFRKTLSPLGTRTGQRQVRY